MMKKIVEESYEREKEGKLISLSEFRTEMGC